MVGMVNSPQFTPPANPSPNRGAVRCDVTLPGTAECGSPEAGDGGGIGHFWKSSLLTCCLCPAFIPQVLLVASMFRYSLDENIHCLASHQLTLRYGWTCAWLRGTWQRADGT